MLITPERKFPQRSDASQNDQKSKGYLSKTSAASCTLQNDDEGTLSVDSDFHFQKISSNFEYFSTPCVLYFHGHVVGQVKQSSVHFLLYVWAGTAAATAKEMINTFLTSTSHLLTTLTINRL